MDHALVLEPGVIDSSTLCIWNQAAVASLGDPETVDGAARGRSNRGVDLLNRDIRADLAFSGQSPDGLSYRV